MFQVRNFASHDPERLIHADGYSKSAEDDLVCACCNASMIYVSAAQESSAFYRPPHFRTKKGQSHREGCEAYREERDFKQAIDSIRDAVRRGDKILLSLNDLGYFGLPENLSIKFGSVASETYKNSELATFKFNNRGHYRQQSVKSIFTLMTMLTIIDKESGPPAFTRLYLTWQGDVRSYAEFVCDDLGFDKDLFKKLYKKAQDIYHPHRFQWKDQVGAYGFPRLIEFRPNSVGKKGDKDIIFGEQRTLNVNKETGARLYLKHAVDIRKLDAEARKRILEGRSVRLLATPKVNQTYAKQAFDDFKNGHTASVRLTWTVIGDHQIQLLKPEQKMGGVLPRPSRKAQLVLL